MSQIFNWASRINSLPFLSKMSPVANRSYSEDEKLGYATSQKLAQQCAVEIAGMIQVGWTEEHAAQLMEVWLRDHGVKVFFHKPFVWWGDRTRFVGVKNYWNYLPTKRRLVEDEIYILDVAPIVNGFVSDIGFSGCFGESDDFDRGIQFLESLRAELPSLAVAAMNGDHLWKSIDQRMTASQYENIHATYPFGVLGHRLHRNTGTIEANFIHFGWQSYWDLLSRGLFGQLLNRDFQGDLRGLWAIEPHIGGRNFGLKFEEILVVEDGKAYWLDHDACFHLKAKPQVGETPCHH